jgi:hypothetical protein
VRISVAATAVVALGAVVTLGACSAPHRDLTIAPSLPRCPGIGIVNAVRVSALGDFPPEASLTAAASPSIPATLALPRATRQVVVEGFGPTGLAAFGRTAPLSLDDLQGSTLGIAYGPPDGLCATSLMITARVGHRATRLGSGAALISGGFDGAAGVTVLELYRPAGDKSSPLAGFVALPAVLVKGAVLAHAATALADGGALITGGVGAGDAGERLGNADQGATRYDADGGEVGHRRILLDPRAGHSATVLADGRVLVAGGCSFFESNACRPGSALATTELYDPEADSFVPGPPLLHARLDHDALLRGDGTVLLVGGVGEGGVALPAEVVDPSEFRSFDAGLLAGRAAALPTGSVLVAGGATTPDTAVALWLSPSELPLPLPALGDPRGAPTVTALDDGGALIAGGGAGPLYLYDGRAGVTPLAARFGASGHAAVRLDDGTVLLAGGTDSGGAVSADAAIYFRSPLSAWSSLPPLTLDGPSDPYLPRRPDRAVASAGQLVVAAPSASSDGRPAELALVAGMEVADFSFDLLVGSRGVPSGAALLFGWRSEASYAFVVVAPGRAVELWRVSSPRSGQSLAEPVAGCRGAVLDGAQLPDGDLAALRLDWRDGALTVHSAGALVLDCRPSPWPRGRVGVGALLGTVVFDNLAVTR